MVDIMITFILLNIFIKWNKMKLVWFGLILKIKKNTEIDLSFFAQIYNK